MNELSVLKPPPLLPVTGSNVKMRWVCENNKNKQALSQLTNYIIYSLFAVDVPGNKGPK